MKDQNEIRDTNSLEELKSFTDKTMAENVYIELCELGKLGCNIDHRAFKKLSEINLNDYECISVSQVVGLILI